MTLTKLMLLWKSFGSLGAGVCVGRNRIILHREALPAPVSGSLGEEPWEAGGLNNGGRSPVTWQALPSKLCRLYIGACSFSWEMSADLQGRTGNFSINTGYCGQNAKAETVIVRHCQQVETECTANVAVGRAEL